MMASNFEANLTQMVEVVKQHELTEISAINKRMALESFLFNYLLPVIPPAELAKAIQTWNTLCWRQKDEQTQNDA